MSSKRDAELGGAVDGRDRLHVVGHAVVGAHARAAEPDRGNAEIFSKHAVFHAAFLVLVIGVTGGKSAEIHCGAATLEDILSEGQGPRRGAAKAGRVRQRDVAGRFAGRLDCAATRPADRPAGSGSQGMDTLSRRTFLAGTALTLAGGVRPSFAHCQPSRRHGGGQEGRQGGLVLLGAGRDRAEGRATCSRRRPASRSSCSAPAAPTSCAASSRRPTAARCSSTC